MINNKAKHPYNAIRSIGVIFLFLCLGSLSLQAQTLPSNNILDMKEEEGKLWVLTDQGLVTAYYNEKAGVTITPVYTKKHRYVSLSIQGDTIWLATDQAIINSYNVGKDWYSELIPYDNDTDTVGYYGSNIPQRKIPIKKGDKQKFFRITSIVSNTKSGDLWMSGYDGGLRQNRYGKQVWERVFLPPSGVEYLDTMQNRQGLVIGTPTVIRGQILGDNVYRCRDVYYSKRGSLWVATDNGVLVTNTVGSKNPSWRRYNYEFGGLASNTILKIKERVYDQDTTIWISSSNDYGKGEDGLSYFLINEGLWQKVFTGERVYDFSFYQDQVFAVTRNGLVIGKIDDKSWKLLSYLRDKNNPTRIIDEYARFRSVVIQVLHDQKKITWLGTTEGLAFSEDNEQTWSIIRADKPVGANNLVYAYPNPFSPLREGRIRIRYLVKKGNIVTIHLLDSSLRVLKTLVDASWRESGEHEEIWNGVTKWGGIVANGVYFYSIEIKNEKTVFGKILVIK